VKELGVWSHRVNSPNLKLCIRRALGMASRFSQARARHGRYCASQTRRSFGRGPKACPVVLAGVAAQSDSGGAVTRGQVPVPVSLSRCNDTLA
jgi:hypothetical protein